MDTGITEQARNNMADFFRFIAVVLLGVLVLEVNSNVVDLNDSFDEMKKDGNFWFVEFYAPWCGHCKRLEPIWEEVASELAKQTSNIVTARLDCTKHRSVAEENEIRGFPTIKFFRGKVSARYTGSHTKDSLVEFALKASRPILIEFKTAEEFEKRKSSSDVFFVFVQYDSEKSQEYKKIVQEIAEQRIAQVMFYTITSTLLPEVVKPDKVPSLLVFKETLQLNFEVQGEAVNQTNMLAWVDQEKFVPFMFVGDSNINDVTETGKMIVFFTFSNKKEHSQINKRLGEVGKKLAYEMYSTYGKHFQFAGIFDTGIIESVVMSTVEVPLILVLNPSTRIYFMLPSSELSESFNEEQLEMFLQDILNGKAVAYGGKTFSVRMWRIWWDVRSSAKEIWTASPLMAMLIFGLPSSVFAFLIAMLCCLDAPSDEGDNVEHQDNGEQRRTNEDEKDADEVVTESTRLKED